MTYLVNLKASFFIAFLWYMVVESVLRNTAVFSFYKAITQLVLAFFLFQK